MPCSFPRVPEPEFMNMPEEAEAYSVADFSEVNQAFADRLVELAGSIGYADALDVGCGPADIPIRIIRVRPAWRITALDASPAMIQWARHNILAAGLSASIRIELADAKNTLLPTAAFDVIFSNSILHHVSDTGAFWREMKRLGRPGAVLFLRDLARPESPEAARAIVRQYAGAESQLLQDEYYRSLLAAYTVDEVRGQLASAGLDTLQAEMATDRHLDIFGRLA
ncbi:MAG: methyltransferase domain-containing protein [Candidatus Sumerlaeota bacterium]|nr:methyltransferase domain-containing protein [Candidatus Sumerlaeota bacterium]